MVKNPPAIQETWVQFLGWEDPLEEGMATHSDILAWRIHMDREVWQATVHWVTNSWMGRSPGGGHGNPLQYFCLENSHGQRSLAGYSPWGHKELDMTKQLSIAHNPTRIGMESVSESRKCYGKRHCLN